VRAADTLTVPASTANLPNQAEVTTEKS